MSVLALSLGCTNAVDGSASVIVAPVIYGTDDRQEYFDVASPDARATMKSAVVALIPKNRLGSSERRFSAASSWGTANNLCPGEPDADQPAVAFCTGVLVDWDLVLTADHCTRVFASEDYVVVFNYFYSAPGELAVSDDDIFDVQSIVAEELDNSGTAPQLDFAWLRLARPAAPPRKPIALYASASPLMAGDPVISISATGGVPLKYDAGGRVRDLRQPQSDYFLADSDTFEGSSGAPLLDSELSLVGILARGGADYVDSGKGCQLVNREPADVTAEEQFTYVNRAVDGLCQLGSDVSSICRTDCGEPCQAGPMKQAPAGGGCSLGLGRPAPDFGVASIAALGWLVQRLRRKSSVGGPHRG